MEARFVRLEGLESPILLLVPSGQPLPEELRVEFGKVARKLDFDRSGEVTWRLQPSSANDEQPVYVEVFDE